MDVDPIRSSQTSGFRPGFHESADEKSASAQNYSHSRQAFQGSQYPSSGTSSGDFYQMGSSQHRGDNYSNLRASDAIFHSSLSSNDRSSSTIGYGSHNGNSYSTGHRWAEGSQDYHDHTSISRATTQPLEGYSASTSVSYATIPSFSTQDATNDNYNSALAATLKATLETSAFSSTEHAAYRAAIEASITALNSLSSLETQIAKGRAIHVAAHQQISKDEIAVSKQHLDYLMADQQVRIIEADLAESKRVIHDLEQTNGDWTESNWTLPAFQAYVE